MTVLYAVSKSNKTKAEQTATPKKYPQGYFIDKPCRRCGKMFSPKAPSELYCSDKCKDEAISSRYLEKTYGITIDEYNTLLEEQDNRCAICGGEGFLMDNDRHKVKLVVDHDHNTGVIRGLLCHNCNRAIGLFHDNVNDLESAIKYLKRATTIPNGSTPKQAEKVSTKR